MTPQENTPTPPDFRRSGSEQSPWALAGLGMQLALALLLFGWLGQWVDRRFGTEPYGLLAGVLLGGGGFFAWMVRRLAASEESK